MHTTTFTDGGRRSLLKAERKARKARKQLTRLFPHLADRLHKGVCSDHLCQLAAALANRNPRPAGHPNQKRIA